jgi:multicomponent Na+:H+ antiporter subunit C
MSAYGFLPYALSAWIFGWGLYGIISSRNWVHLVICLAVLQSATYLLLLGIGYRIGAAAPVFAQFSASTVAVDPVVQALMLTDVVVEVTVTALLLALAVQAHERTGQLDPTKLGIIRG